MDLKAIYQALGALSTDELRLLNAKVVEVLKDRRDVANLTAKAAFAVGDGVEVLRGLIKEINRTKAVVFGVARGKAANWTVPFGMLELDEA